MMMIYTRSSVQSLQRLCRNILSVWMALRGLSWGVDALDQENVMSTPGQTAILPCKAPSNMSVLAVEWHRHGLEGYVLSYRDNQLDPEDQDASYRDRVDLKDRHIQNGDLSLLLTNVMASDTGTYECRAFQRAAKRRKRHSEVLSIINLNVTLSGPTDEKSRNGVSSDAGIEGNRLQLSVLVFAVIVVL